MLSERLRPNSECAPWVIEEVKKLEGEAACAHTVRLILSKMKRRSELSDCECDGCLTVIQDEGEKTCHRCGYHGHFSTVPCVCDAICDPWPRSSAMCPHGALKCPVCEDGDTSLDPWKYLKAIQMAMRGEKPEVIGKHLMED
jgi:hypothetical protein